MLFKAGKPMRLPSVKSTQKAIRNLYKIELIFFMEKFHLPKKIFYTEKVDSAVYLMTKPT